MDDIGEIDIATQAAGVVGDLRGAAFPFDLVEGADLRVAEDPVEFQGGAGTPALLRTLGGGTGTARPWGRTLIAGWACPGVGEERLAVQCRQAGNDALKKKAALRWTMIEQWATMADLDGTGPYSATYASAPDDKPWVIYQPKDLKAASDEGVAGGSLAGGWEQRAFRPARFRRGQIRSGLLDLLNLFL